MSSEEIISTKELMDGMIDSDFPPGWWERSWVPFLHNGAGSHLCIDTAGTDGNPPGQLVEFWNRDHDRPVVSPSLEHWFNDFVTSLERDRWEYTEYGFECVERQEEIE
jgi:cell wall assembly regulator SMI1